MIPSGTVARGKPFGISSGDGREARAVGAFLWRSDVFASVKFVTIRSGVGVPVGTFESGFQRLIHNKAIVVMNLSRSFTRAIRCRPSWLLAMELVRTAVGSYSHVKRRVPVAMQC